MKSKQQLAIFLLVLAVVASAFGALKNTDADFNVVADEPALVEASEARAAFQGNVGLPAALASRPEIIVERMGYTLSYNTETNTPNYVAWQLTDEECKGVGERKDEFSADSELPRKNRVQPWDYKGSGYSRGHMCPAADMKWSGRAMADCFLMSNMCPQLQALNGGAWAKLENACRRWAQREGSVYICCGPIFDEHPGHIGKDVRIAVPAAFFKVVLCLNPGREKAIGFVYKHTAEKQNMAHAAVSVDEVERLTDIDFFEALPDELESTLEAQCAFKKWQ